MSGTAPAGGGLAVVVNGAARSVRAGATVADLIGELGLEGRRVAVERNRQIVKRADWAATSLEEGDHLEVLHFVGGG